MILPNVRASFGRSEAGTILGLLAGGDSVIRERVDDQLRDQGLDALLDDPRTLNAVLTADHDVRPPLVFYLLVRHALLESGIDDRVLADYLAALLLEFGRGDRAFRVTADDPERFQYMVDLMAAADTDDGRRRFLIRAHMGEYALWLTGIFPDHVTARVVRRGAPGLDYFQEMGITGYRLAANSRLAAEHGMDAVYRTAAEAFADLRVALNLVSDRYLFPGRRGSTERLLRQVRDAFSD
ncbi:MAG TPA: hypothetical protein VK966_13795 [Longimicrobiales bacterium]|nr:hypothetical protein [Longimicrobiales bacterium]